MPRPSREMRGWRPVSYGNKGCESSTYCHLTSIHQCPRLLPKLQAGALVDRLGRTSVAQRVQPLRNRNRDYSCGSHDGRPPSGSVRGLNAMLRRVWRSDRKKAHVIGSYFDSMEQVLREFHSVTRASGHLCLITGDNTICGIRTPTHRILSKLAQQTGFRLVEEGVDSIENRALPPSRNHRGGMIEEEWITVFRK